jgi:hypothetical protein
MSDNFTHKSSSDRVLRSNKRNGETSFSTSTDQTVLIRRKSKGKNIMESGEDDEFTYATISDRRSDSDEVDSPSRTSRKIYEMHLVKGEKVHLLEDSLQEDDVSFLEGKSGEENESFWTITGKHNVYIHEFKT